MHRLRRVCAKSFPSRLRTEAAAGIVVVNIGRCDDYWKSDDRGAVETTAGAAGESTLSEVLVAATRFVGALGPALVLIAPTPTARDDMPCYRRQCTTMSMDQKKPKSGVGGKQGAKDVPSWAKGKRP